MNWSSEIALPRALFSDLLRSTSIQPPNPDEPTFLLVHDDTSDERDECDERDAEYQGPEEESYSGVGEVVEDEEGPIEQP